MSVLHRSCFASALGCLGWLTACAPAPSGPGAGAAARPGAQSPISPAASALPAPSAAASDSVGLPPLPPERVQPAISTSYPKQLAWTGQGSVMVEVPGTGALRAFFIDRTEVSALDAERFEVARHGARDLPTRSRQPRYGAQLTYLDAQAYCRAQGKRLPSFAEWQAAAGPNAKRSAANEPSVVDAGAPNRLGIFGLENDLLEWTSTRGREKEHQRVGGVDHDPPEIVRESAELGLRCAADRAAVRALPSASRKVTLHADWGMCARLESTRESYCWGGLPAPLGGQAPAISRQPIRVAALDTAISAHDSCALWPHMLVCDPDGAVRQYKQTDPAVVDYFSALGGIFTLDAAGNLVNRVPTGDGGYGLQHQTVKRALPLFGGFLVETLSQGWTFAGLYNLNGSPEYVGQPQSLVLPGDPTAAFEVADGACLRVGAELKCGQLSPGAFKVSATVAKPIRAVAQFGHHCLLLDSGALHCGAGSLTISRLNAALQPPVLEDVVEIQQGYGMLCAVDQAGGVSCTSRELQNEILHGGVASSVVKFERIQLPALR